MEKSSGYIKKSHVKCLSTMGLQRFSSRAASNAHEDIKDMNKIIPN